MNWLKKNAGELIICAFEIVAGVLLLLKPIGFTALSIVLAGVLLCIMGIGSVVKYFRTDIKEAVKGQELFKGSVLLIGGLFCAFRSDWFVATFPLMTVIYGVAVLLAALIKFQNTVNFIRLKKEKWFVCAIGAAISAVCSVVILLNPFSTTDVLWIFTGVTLIVEAFVDVISLAVNASDSTEKSAK